MLCYFIVNVISTWCRKGVVGWVCKISLGLVADSVTSDEEDFEAFALFDRDPREVYVDRDDAGEQMGCGVLHLLEHRLS